MHHAMTNTIKTQSGYALLEIMLAFAVGAIIITGIVSLGVVSVRGLTASRASSEAGKIAQREVDRLKIMRDSLPWSNGTNGFYDKLAVCTHRCYIDTSVNPFDIINNNAYTENIGGFSITYSIIAVPDTDEQKYINYTVDTTWELRGVTKHYKIEGALTNWRES